MAVTTDIARAWISPRAFLRERLDQGVREDRALAVLMGAMALIFLAQMPRLARAAELDLRAATAAGRPLADVPALDARLAGALMAILFLLPLICYALAGGLHLVARALGGRGTFFGARLATFWAFLAISPAMLLHGLLAGLIGTGTVYLVTGALVAAAFLWLCGTMLIEAER